jgi:glycerophosphoryl diester phosphodiesterase
VKVLAHRGASAYAPENTHAAFKRAIDLAADGIETDVRASKDGVLVLLHDERVDRTTNGTGRVADLTLAELRDLDAGAWFDPAFAGERIVTLSDFLDTYGRQLPICLEVKAPGVEAALVAEVVGRDIVRSTQFTSFSFDSTVALRRLLPDAVVGYLTPNFDDDTIARCRAASLSQICPRADTVTSERVAAARLAGLGVRAWGVGTRELVAQVRDAGVDGATINWPDWR